LDEDKTECSKTNEARIRSTSSYQISVAVIESDANLNVWQPPATLEDRPNQGQKLKVKHVLHRKLIYYLPNDPLFIYLFIYQTTLVVGQVKQLKK